MATLPATNRMTDIPGPELELAKAEQRREEMVRHWPDLVVIRTDIASVDLAIVRALALAVEGTMVRIEL
jgi:hypothetical protein